MLAALRAYRELRDPAAIRAWLFSIAARKAIDQPPRATRARRRPAEDLDALAAARERRATRDDALWARVRRAAGEAAPGGHAPLSRRSLAQGDRARSWAPRTPPRGATSSRVWRACAGSCGRERDLTRAPRRTSNAHDQHEARRTRSPWRSGLRATRARPTRRAWARAAPGAGRARRRGRPRRRRLRAPRLAARRARARRDERRAGARRPARRGRGRRARRARRADLAARAVRAARRR